MTAAELLAVLLDEDAASPTWPAHIVAAITLDGTQ